MANTQLRNVAVKRRYEYMDVMVENWFNFTYRHFGSFWGWNNPFLAPVVKNN